MFDLAVQWLIVTVDISVKAMVLAAIAMLSLRLLKLHDSNLRHRTWTGVLIGMLLLPVLSQNCPPCSIPSQSPSIGKSTNAATSHLPTASVDTEDAKLIAIGVHSNRHLLSLLTNHRGNKAAYRPEWSDDGRVCSFQILDLKRNSVPAV